MPAKDGDLKANYADVPYYRLLLHDATGRDYLLVAAATFGALLTGVLMPLMLIFFGDLMDSFDVPGVSFEAMLDFRRQLPEALQDQFSVAKSVAPAALKMVYVGVGLLGTGFLQQCGWMLVAESATNRIRVSYLRALLKQETAYFDSYASTGALLEQMTSSIERINLGTGAKVGIFLQQGAVFVAGITIGLVWGWKLALVILATAPLLGVCGAVMMHMMSKAKTMEQDGYERAGAITEEVLGNIRTVAAFTGEEKAHGAYVGALKHLGHATFLTGASAGIGMGAVLFIMFCSYALALWYGGELILADPENYTGGTVLVIFFSVLIGAFGIGQALPNLSSIADARMAARAVFHVIDRRPAIDDEAPGDELPKLQGGIDFAGVQFAYPARPDVPVFEDFSLSIPAGATVALVGESGSGKSTVISLIERFYDPLAGRVTLDGVDVRKLQLSWLRGQIGLVSQEPVLFAASIRDNILYGKPDASEAEVVAAAKSANAHNFIAALPDGYDTLCGERGTQMSGGQKQRIAIARAIIKDPKILLLDEATSALDAESERVVQSALDGLMGGRTTVVVAHRLSTVRAADKIAVVQKGRIVEEGTHAELIGRRDGKYSALVKLQTRSAPSSENLTGLRKVASLLGLEAAQARTGQLVGPEEEEAAGSGAKGDSSRSSIDVVVPTAQEETQPAGFMRVLAYGRDDWLYLAVGSIASVGAGTLFPLFAIFLANLITVFYNPAALETQITYWAIRFVILAVVALVSVSLQATSFGIAAARLTLKVRGECFKALMRQEVAYFDLPEHNSATLSTTLAKDATHIKGMVGDRLMLIVQNIVTMVFAICVSFYYGWRLALVVLAITPLQALGAFIEMKTYTGDSGSENDVKTMYAAATQVASEAVGNKRTVDSYVARDNVLATYVYRMRSVVAKGINNSIVAGLAFGYSQFMQLVPWAVVFYIGAIFIDKGWMTFNEMLLVFMGLTFASMGIAQSAAIVPDIGKAEDAVKNVFSILDRAPRIDAQAPGDYVEPVGGRIELKGVQFAYPARPDVPVFEDFSLSIPAGATVALVGESGSGKSTVISLIERFYDPLAGRVTLDGVDVRKLQLSWLRGQIGLVSQEPVLFAASIRDNILYGKPDASEAEVVAAAKSANAHNFIAALPDGYDTLCGERGTQMSGGQKQRIAIARAIIKDPKILLLDEATSALDAESERVVQSALDGLMGGRTTVVVAHRLSTVRAADKIAVVQKGRIVEEGQYEALLANRDGAFSQLVRLQQHD